MWRADVCRTWCKVLALSTWLVFVPQASAGLATEWTQIANNVQLLRVALDSAQTARTTVQQALVQWRQFETQLRENMGLDKLPDGFIADALRSVKALQGFRQALEQLHGSLSQEQATIDQRFTEARLGGLDWSTYVQQQEQLLAQQNERAKHRLAYEQSVLQQVASDFEFAQRMQAEIPESVGQQQSLQQLNLHMNRMVTQNARMLQAMSAQLRDSGNEEADKASSNRRVLAELEALRARQAEISARQRDFASRPSR